eukprot:TRINITY_DN2816_c0_g1_i1.p1 TRINITY_DN2816_c0_g1~~TRINITY_DN2816_c0_g1_i1.p1  ORF type:complete len:519 (-),score=81.14 TRINITY_DN2816_c0_g1_i1:37-1593(-)
MCIRDRCSNGKKKFKSSKRIEKLWQMTKMNAVVLLLLSCLLHSVSSQVLNCTYFTTNETEIDCAGVVYIQQSEHHDAIGSTAFFIDLAIIAFLVLLAGLMSGLTLGLLGMDPTNLEILKNAGDESQKVHAKRIIPLVKRHHLLLVTLLLTNAAAMEALPIFLDRIVNPIVAVIISVTLVLAFGEVIPQAVCSRFGLAIGSWCSYFVWVLMFLLLPISWPVAKILDLLLGHNEGQIYKRDELKELMNIHAEHQGLSKDEVQIITGALDMHNKDAGSCMTPLKQVKMLNAEEKLNLETIHKIRKFKHSRFPVYKHNKSNIIGILFMKDLVGVDTSGTPKIEDLPLKKMPIVQSDMKLYPLLDKFQLGKSHLALVQDVQTKTFVGIITLEDVIEELIQEEIIDESESVKSFMESIGTPGRQESMTSLRLGARMANNLRLSSSKLMISSPRLTPSSVVLPRSAHHQQQTPGAGRGLVQSASVNRITPPSSPRRPSDLIACSSLPNLEPVDDETTVLLPKEEV